MFKKARPIPKAEKLNLIPIMDAVFIFIFFLIFSSQFIKMFDIESEAPLISEVPHSKKLEKDPLNLTVEITEDTVYVKTGIDQKTYATFSRNSSSIDTELKETVLKLRQENQNEDHIIIAPSQDVSYEDIVTYIDTVQKLPQGMKELELSEKGKRVSKIFNQIVLEPLNNEL